jgi:hypothetical protein
MYGVELRIGRMATIFTFGYKNEAPLVPVASSTEEWAAMVHHSCKFPIPALIVASLIAAPAYGEAPTATQKAASSAHASLPTGGPLDHKDRRCVRPIDRELLFDDFDGPNLNPIWQASLPNAPYRFGSVLATYLGESNFSFQSLNDSSVIRLQNVLANTERRGWSSATSFPSDAPIVYEARFNTLVQSFSTGIDELLEIWLLDADKPDSYDIVALSTPGFGSGRIFTAGSSITGLGLDTVFFFDNNTWYRMVISGSQTQEVRAAIHDDAGTELISVGFGHDLGAYASGFRIGISQSMGFPQAPFPTDVAIDSVRLTAAPSATVVIGECDSGVANPVFPSGCAISDLVAECGERARHPGKFVRCVSQLTNELKRVGVITDRQKGAIKSCAAEATNH